MSKKYKIRKDGRIEALHSFGNVKKGDIGGFVESENNLLHKGTCWVYNDARVSDSARVSDYARVFGNARVSDNAVVSDYARVFGNARVSDSAWVSNSAQVFDNAKVSDDARVSGSAWVSDNAWASGSAWVSNSAQVFDNAKVFGIFKNGNCPVFVGTKDIVSYSGIINNDHFISIGCEKHSLTDWKTIYRKIGAKYKYSEKQIDEYGYYISIIEMIIKR